MLLCLPPPVSPLSATLHAMPALGLFLHGEREREKRKRKRREREEKETERERVRTRAADPARHAAVAVWDGRAAHRGRIHRLVRPG